MTCIQSPTQMAGYPVDQENFQSVISPIMLIRNSLAQKNNTNSKESELISMSRPMYEDIQQNKDPRMSLLNFSSIMKQ